MITKDNFKTLLLKPGFSGKGDVLRKYFPDIDTCLKVDFKSEKIIYPKGNGFKVNEKQTCNFSQNKNVNI